jgi:diguanylate cyclase (GGDEF)-like protein/PAS domain S-box-containing protein
MSGKVEVAEKPFARRIRSAVNSFFIDNPFPMFVFDPTTLCFLEANNAAARHYGFSREEFAGMKITRLRVGSEQELVDQLRNLPTGSDAFYPATHRKRDGSLIDVEVAVGAIRWNGSDIGFSIVRDVTEQRKTQATLARVLRAAEIGIWELDLTTYATTWSDEVYRMFGYHPPATITFERFLSHIVPEDRPRFDAAFNDALMSGKPNDVEYRMRRIDGTERTLHRSAVVELDEEQKPARIMGTVIDVTDRRALQQELRMRSDALAMAQRIARLGSWDIDLVTGRLDWSQELYEIYGMRPGVNVPGPDELWKHDHPEDAQQVLRTVSRARYNRTQYNLDHRIVRLDGETRWVQEQGEYAYDQAGKPNRFIGTMLDITERKRAEERVEYLAGHDQVTGLPNYSLLLDRLRQSIVQTQLDGGKVAVAYLDVDRFKSVNDAGGYDAGDKVLKEIAQRLQASVLPGDSVSRAGGDEFIIVLPNIQKSTEIGGKAHGILRVFDTPFQVGDRVFHFTASMGISVYPDDIGDASQLIRNADMAMYQGKGKARNNFQFFSAQMHERTIRRLSLERDLRRAIERDELALEYQPILEAGSNSLAAVEALVRWHPTGKQVVGPAEFIPIAEDTGLIVSIGEWILRRACRQWRAWCDSGLRPIRIAANISGKQLERQDFIDTLKSALADARMPAECLDLEITETVLMTQTALPDLDALKALGLRLVIDDFGTGFSSLAYLKRMPIGCLKIDRSFVAYAASGRAADVPISTAIIAIARNLGLQVVAEGVETENQARVLRDLGCDFLQGYYFAVPSSPELIAAMLKG